jgi:steroid delta-isomerase-like uncharacterized protein
MTEEAKRVLHDVVAAVNSHDVEKMALFFTDDCLYEDVASGGVMRGTEALKAAYRDVFAEIPDFRLEVVSLFIAGDWAGSEWVMTGTSTTGKSFSTRGVSVIELEGLKVKRHRDYYDPSSIQQATR